MGAEPIKIKDNHESDVITDARVVDCLRPYSERGLDEICLNNPSLLLFPDCLGDNGDKITDALYSIGGNEETGWTIGVGNIVGFWGVNGVNVHVHSRFDDEKRQYFFHYMLQRIAGVNVLDLKTLPDSDDIWDFLIYLFPMALKRAVRQGIFRAYRVLRYDDDRVKGAIDVPRYIRRDVPFAGRVAYTAREHTANNHVIQLVRHAIEFIRRKAPALLTADAEMRQAVEAIVQVTPDYSDKARTKVVAANLRPVRHPYYSAYSGLQKLCLEILRNEKLSFGESDGSICGIVFDAAWLWEEYLNAVFAADLQWKSIVHPQNKLGLGRVYYCRDCRSHYCYPDFYDKTRNLVFDAKYKRLNSGIGADDFVQMVSYLHILEARHGAFLKPDPTETKYYLEGTLNTAVGETIGVCTLKIPQMTEERNFCDFVGSIGDEETKFKCEIGKLEVIDEGN